MSRRDADHSHDYQLEDAATSRTSLEAATEAAQRINALLIAKGMLKPSQVSSVPHKTKQQVILPEYAVLCRRPQRWTAPALLLHGGKGKGKGCAL